MTTPIVIVISADTETYDVPEYGRIIWNKLPYAARLALTSYLFTKMSSHNGTFRRLIYDELGFDQDAYQELYLSGGMRITNALTDYDPIIVEDEVNV